jgi:hypothetical protein
MDLYPQTPVSVPKFTRFGEGAGVNGWRWIVGIVSAAVVFCGGLLLALLLGIVSTSRTRAPFHPTAADMAAAHVLGAGAVCNLLGAVLVVLGVGMPRWRWPFLAAAVAYALAGVLCLSVQVVDPQMGGVSDLALPAVVLALLTPWWWRPLSD